MNKGFTLIELLVAISVGMVLVGFGSVSLNNFNQNQKVESVKEELLSNLKLARNYAVTNQLPDDSPVDTDRIAVEIDIDGLMIIKTEKNDGTDAGHTFFSKDITPKGVVITAPIIRFSINNGRSIDGFLTIPIEAESANTRIINIAESGLIYE
jgi:prepilin-type N-terminal cleavage/methylation domain-containing protein